AAARRRRPAGGGRHHGVGAALAAARLHRPPRPRLLRHPAERRQAPQAHRKADHARPPERVPGGVSALDDRPQEVSTINRLRQPAPARPSTRGQAGPAPRGRVLALAFAFALGALLAGGVVFGVTRPSSIEQAADRLRAESALRDQTQIKTLTELARDTRTRLLPVLDGLALALPGEGAAGPVAVTAADVEKWRQAADAAVQGFADPPSGETATNVARSSLASAVRQFATTVDTYAMARDLTGPARAAALDLAARQRAD